MAISMPGSETAIRREKDGALHICYFEPYRRINLLLETTTQLAPLYRLA